MDNQAYFRGNRVTVLEITATHAWVQFENSDNSRRVKLEELVRIGA